MFLNESLICKIGFEPVVCDIFGAQKTVSTTRPLKKILVDGDISEMDFRGLFPCVRIRNVERGIRFDGPPREIVIDDVPFLVNVDKGRKVQFGNVNHVIGLGGPGHEVIVNGKWYECKFSGAEKDIVLGMNHHRIKLIGPPPEVKILGEFIEDKKMIKKLCGNLTVDPAFNLDDRVMREPPKARPRSPPLMRDSPLLDLRPPEDRRGYNGPPDGHPRGPRPFIDGPPGPRPMHRPGPGPRFDGPRGPPRFEGPPGRYDGPPERGAPPPHYDYDYDPDPRYDSPGQRYDGPPDQMRRGYKGSLLGGSQTELKHAVLSRRLSYSPRRHSSIHLNKSPIYCANQIELGQAPTRRLSLDLPLPPESRNTPPRDLDPRGAPPPRDLDPRGPPVRDPRDPRRGRPDGPPGPRDGPPGRYEGGPPMYDGPDRYGPRGRGQMWSGPEGHPRTRGPHPRDEYGPGPGQRGPPYRPSYPGPPAPGSYGGPPQPAGPIDVDGLLTNLLAKGLIGPSNPAPTQPPNIPSAAPEGQPFNALDFIMNRSRPSHPAQPKEIVEAIPNLTEFSVDRLKIRYRGSYQSLYAGIQCSSCGSRFTPDRVDKYKEHLDWHFRQNKREKQEIKVAKFRRWYYTAQEWMQYEEFGDVEERAQSAYFEKIKNLQDGNHGAASPSGGVAGSTNTVTTSSGMMHSGADEPISCPAASGSENDNVCAICGDTFEQFWDEDAEEWHLKDAVRVNDKTYHPTCYEDAKKGNAEPTSPATASPEIAPSNPLSVLMTALSSPTSTKSPAAIPIVPVKQEVKPELSVAATADQQDLPAAAVTAIKEEVVEPSGGATPVRDEPTVEAKPVETVSAVKQEPMDTSVVPSAVPDVVPTVVPTVPVVKEEIPTVKEEVAEPSTPTRDEAPDDRCMTPTQDESPSTPTQDEPAVSAPGEESSSIPVVQIKL